MDGLLSSFNWAFENFCNIPELGLFGIMFFLSTLAVLENLISKKDK